MQGNSVSKINPFNKFTNLNYTQIRDKMNSAYNPEFQAIYQDKFSKEQEKEQKRKKAFKLSALIFSGITAAGIVGTLIYEICRGKINVSKLTNGVKNSTTDFVQNNKYFNKFVNAMINFSNIKDDVWTRFSNWTDKKGIKFIKKADETLANFYRHLSKSKYEKEYTETFNLINKCLRKENLSIPGFAQNYDKWYDELNSTIIEALNKDGNITKGLTKKDKLFKTLTSEILSENKLKDVRIRFLSDLEIPNGASKELQEAIEKFNTLNKKAGPDILERLRDTNLGNASTDTLGVFASLGALGCAIGNAENKEERKSTMINLGIPLVSTLISMVYGTMRCLSGSSAIIFGFASGQVASIVAKTVDNLIKKKNTEIKA